MCKDVYEDGKVRLYASYSSQSGKMRFDCGGRYKRSSFRSVYCFNLEKIKNKELFYETVPCYIFEVLFVFDRFLALCDDGRHLDISESVSSLHHKYRTFGIQIDDIRKR